MAEFKIYDEKILRKLLAGLVILQNLSLIKVPNLIICQKADKLLVFETQLNCRNTSIMILYLENLYMRALSLGVKISHFRIELVGKLEL